MAHLIVQSPEAPISFKQDNPKKPGPPSQPYKSFLRYDKYKAAKTLQQVLDLGGVKGDIVEDFKKGHLTFEDAEFGARELAKLREEEQQAAASKQEKKSSQQAAAIGKDKLAPRAAGGAPKGGTIGSLVRLPPRRSSASSAAAAEQQPNAAGAEAQAQYGRVTKIVPNAQGNPPTVHVQVLASSPNSQPETCFGSATHLTVVQTTCSPEEAACNICGESGPEKQKMACNGFGIHCMCCVHLECHSPPLTSMPNGGGFCAFCMRNGLAAGPVQHPAKKQPFPRSGLAQHPVKKEPVSSPDGLVPNDEPTPLRRREKNALDEQQTLLDERSALLAQLRAREADIPGAVIRAQQIAAALARNSAPPPGFGMPHESARFPHQQQAPLQLGSPLGRGMPANAPPIQNGGSSERDRLSKVKLEILHSALEEAYRAADGLGFGDVVFKRLHKSIKNVSLELDEVKRTQGGPLNADEIRECRGRRDSSQDSQAPPQKRARQDASHSQDQELRIRTFMEQMQHRHSERRESGAAFPASGSVPLFAEPGAALQPGQLQLQPGEDRVLGAAFPASGEVHRFQIDHGEQVRRAAAQQPPGRESNALEQLQQEQIRHRQELMKERMVELQQQEQRRSKRMVELEQELKQRKQELVNEQRRMVELQQEVGGGSEDATMPEDSSSPASGQVPSEVHGPEASPPEDEAVPAEASIEGDASVPAAAASAGMGGEGSKDMDATMPGDSSSAASDRVPSEVQRPEASPPEDAAAPAPEDAAAPEDAGASDER